MNSNNCSTSVCASALLAVASLAFSPAAWSLGLGDAKVESYLNQPLKARIDLITQASDDLASVSAQLASAADYELIGASRESVSVPIRFSVEEIDGDAYILATSNLPLGDPVLRLIVEVNWSSGRMLREYTLFLDPPMVAEPAPAPRIDQRRGQVAPATAPTPAADRDVAPSAADAAARPAVSVPAGDAEYGAEYGPVQSGQTLWGIASNWSRGSGLDVNTVMIAIQRDNPDAFLKDNINLLKRGAILRMPDAADVQAIPRASAYREVVAQNEAFSGRAAATSVASPSTPLLAGESAAFEPAATELTPEEPASPAAPSVAAEQPAADASVPATEADVTEPAVETAEAEVEAAAAAPPQDLLELVPPSEDSELAASGFEQGEAGAGANLQTLREELARTEEELITQQQQNAYLEERLQELESQLESAGEGRVGDAELANMEERLREQRQEAVATRSEPDKPWYSRMIVWLVALLVLAAAFVGWLVSRRGHGGEAAGAAHSPLRDIKHEAEDVLRVLGEDREATVVVEQAAASAGKTKAEAKADAKVEAEAQAEAEAEKKAAGRYAAHVEDAEVLDEESSDPEIQLDLARAYISMGDKEAARVILEEVVNNGSEDQQAEARKMLDVLS
jgi:pilus assembly protein FimV